MADCRAHRRLLGDLARIALARTSRGFLGCARAREPDAGGEERVLHGTFGSRCTRSRIDRRGPVVGTGFGCRTRSVARQADARSIVRLAVAPGVAMDPGAENIPACAQAQRPLGPPNQSRTIPTQAAPSLIR